MGRADTWPAVAGALLCAGLILFWPPPLDRQPPYATSLRAIDGSLLGAQTSRDGQWRFAATTAVPERYRQALIQFEDRRFAGHLGLDSRSLLRALLDNWRQRDVVSGASTLSMQAARLLYGPSQRSYTQKARELLAALRLEFRLSKDSLLELYASLAPYGANVVGLEAAGFRWFGRGLDSLTWAEAALLAVLPNSPALIHPGRSRDQLLAKRDRLLLRLANQEQLDDPALALALAEPLPGAPVEMPNLTPHLTLAASAAGAGDHPSSIDYGLQLAVREVARRHQRRLALHAIDHLAAVVLRVSDGSVAAYIGNVDPAADRPGSFVDCALAARSSGSIFKPFLYAAMLDSGELTPDRLVPDIPTRVGSYSPENNLKNYSGAVPAKVALARSLNIPFVRLLRAYGVERFGRLLRRLGFAQLRRALDDYGLPLILGGAEATLLEAAMAYRVLAESALVPYNAPGRDLPFSAGAAWLTLQALLEVGRPGEDAAWQQYANSRQISWKTGTSFGNRDAWAIGVTPDWVVAVWAGNADGVGRPELKGTDAAAPFLFDLFQLLPRAAWFRRPTDDLRAMTLCADSGYAAGRDCPATVVSWVPALAQVDQACPWCRLVHLSADGRHQVSATCVSPANLVSARRFVLPPVMEWYYAREHLEYRPLPPWLPGCQPADASVMELVAPEPGSSLFIPVELDGTPGLAVFRAVHRQSGAVIFWHLDDDYLGQTQGDHRLAVRPLPGPHRLVLVDGSGNRLERGFTVAER
ncbi:MAG: penicillin-binding protein 1C [Spirochaetes bacterium GWD1_61_31]|nr:MAG: penicillin-binding protein 1C [Spirochaetes bacterium GWB1_60_80]OHD32578.1 MAG: penicillin-binding protein 1C [Spirochaetes bacterium GWC1_61_12]OHD34807.1 MAG: penicillin-binding protein 1C [Spirochaetes bacterium GWD1_61_31]OHD44582.1 MAG: penicillin-binding protein 1C [Spirochaetes bacterium GWE1_60_18]HAW87087.1 penicillin-binding protein 1C [Spirochaetaceae bacterium]